MNEKKGGCVSLCFSVGLVQYCLMLFDIIQSYSMLFKIIWGCWMFDVVRCRCAPTKDKTNTWYLLNERERHLVRQLDLCYKENWQEQPDANPQLVYFLGDRYEYSKTWSACSSALPTFRKNNAKYLHRASMSFYTDQEKMAALGWPVRPDIAEQMLVTPMPERYSSRCGVMCGNSMHLSVAGIVFMAAACCFGKVGLWYVLRCLIAVGWGKNM